MTMPEFSTIPQETRHVYKTVTKQLPIAHLISSVATGTSSLAEQDKLLKQATEKFSDPHERWELVRHGRARLITGLLIDESSNATINPSGWEGFYAGSALSPKDIIREQASLGLQIMDSMGRNSPEAFLSAKRIIESGQGFSIEALRELEIYFKIIKARFDAIDPSSEAIEFRAQTASLVMTMPPIELRRKGLFIIQTLPLPADEGDSARKTPVDLSWRERSGYRFMARVGIVGNPVIRAILERDKEAAIKKSEKARAKSY